VLRTFIALKNPSTWPGSNPRCLGPVASTLTTTPPRRQFRDVVSSDRNLQSSTTARQRLRHKVTYSASHAQKSRETREDAPRETLRGQFLKMHCWKFDYEYRAMDVLSALVSVFGEVRFHCWWRADISLIMTNDPWFTQVPTSISTSASGRTHPAPDVLRLWLRDGTRGAYGGFWRHSLANLICRVVPPRFLPSLLSLLQLGSDRAHCCKNNCGSCECRCLASSTF
jgi:hypothetical protein